MRKSNKQQTACRLHLQKRGQPTLSACLNLSHSAELNTLRVNIFPVAGFAGKVLAKGTVWTAACENNRSDKPHAIFDANVLVRKTLVGEYVHDAADKNLTVVERNIPRDLKFIRPRAVSQCWHVQNRTARGG